MSIKNKAGFVVTLDRLADGKRLPLATESYHANAYSVFVMNEDLAGRDTQPWLKGWLEMGIRHRMLRVMGASA